MSQEESSIFASRRGFLGVGVGLIGWPLAAGARDIIPSEPAMGTATHALPYSSAGLPGGSPNRSMVADAVERSLNSIVTFGLDSNFPRPYELELLEHDHDLRRDVAAVCLGCFEKPVTIGRCLAGAHTAIFPKASTFGHRRCLTADVVGAAFYLACAVLAGPYIERARIPAIARRIFSFRFKSDGASIFDDAFNYGAFRDRTVAKLDPRERAYVVCADIASFYPSIDNDRLLVRLAALGVEPWICGALCELLSHWQSKWGAGLPVGPAASALLAEAALIDVDRRLDADGVDYIRYVDDFRLFAPTARAARNATERLIEHLAQDGLQLNEAKTTFECVTREEYLDHLNARRSARYWGGRQGPPVMLLAQNSQKKEPESGEKSEGKKKDNDRQEAPEPEKPPSVPSEYGQSPFKKTELNEFDVALLSGVEADAIWADEIAHARDGAPVMLGTIRVLVEIACLRGEYERIADVLELLDNCHQAVSYVVDVLLSERERIPESVRAMARDWFAARLVAGNRVSDYEALHLAGLLGATGYQCATAILGYLDADWCALSPIVVRACLVALHGQCDARSAAILVERALPCERLVRRAAFDLAWPYLEPGQRELLRRKYRQDFEIDPFMRRLLTMEGVSA